MLHDISLIYFTVVGVFIFLFILSEIGYRKTRKKKNDKIKELKNNGKN